MELHHSGHHRAYVGNLNAAAQQLSALAEAKDVAAQIALQETIKFNGGGHINHFALLEESCAGVEPGRRPGRGTAAGQEDSRDLG